jgi:hypothetical protein
VFYNDERKHQPLVYRTPGESFAAARACGDVHNASALHTSPQAQQPQTEKDSNHDGKAGASNIGLLAA